MAISCPAISTVFIPPGAISSELIARTNLSPKAHVLWRPLGQAIRVGDILVDEEPAPTAFDSVEMLPVEGNAWADDLHVECAVVAHRLAGAEGNAVLALQHHFLFQQKIRQLRVGREFEAQRPHYFVVEIAKRLFPRFSIHSTPPYDFSAFE